MGAVYIPDPLTAPELWYPGRKPVMPVKVNWQHPNSRNLQVLLLKGFKSSARPISLVNNGDTISYQDERYLFTGSSSEYISFNDSIFSSNRFTLVLTLKIESITSNFPAIFSNGTSGTKSGFLLFYNTSSNKLEAELYNTDPIAKAVMSYSILGGQEVNLVVKSDGVSSIKIFVNGRFDSQATIPTENIIAPDESRITRIGKSANSFWGRLNGHIKYFAYFDADISDAAASALSLNPYQILEAA